MCYTIPGSKLKAAHTAHINNVLYSAFLSRGYAPSNGRHSCREETDNAAASTAVSTAQFCVKGKLYIFVAMHSFTNDVTQNKFPHDLTRQIFLGSHCRMCYIPNARSSRVTVYMYTHLQSVPSAACTIRDLLCLPSAAHSVGLQPHRRQYRADKRGVSLCVTSQI